MEVELGRSRYKTYDEAKTYFTTMSTTNWLPLFSIPQVAQVILNSLQFMHDNNRIRLHAYVIMETHVHMVGTSKEISDEFRKLKSYTARQIVDYLTMDGPQVLLDQLKFYKKKHKKDQKYQVWQEGFHPKAILNVDILTQKIEYVHYNPVRRGYVDRPEHWRYSSAQNYAGMKGIVSVEHVKI